MFKNENILKLIFSSLKGKRTHITIINNKLINKSILKSIDYGQMYKSFRQSKIVSAYYSSEIVSLTLLNDEVIITGSFDNIVKAWNISNFTKLKTFNGPLRVIESSRNDNLLYTASNGKIELWEYKEDNFKCIKAINLSEPYKSLKTLSLSNGNIVCASVNYPSISILDFNNNYGLAGIIIGKSAVQFLTSMEDNRFAVGFCHAVIEIYDNINNIYDCLATLNGHSHGVNALLYVKKYNTLLSGSYDRTIKVWDCDTYSCIKTILTSFISVRCFCSLPGGFFAFGSDNKIKILDLVTFECIRILEDHHKCVSSLVSLKDGCLISGSLDTTMRFYEIFNT
jgi:WD40 repeat protein